MAEERINFGEGIYHPFYAAQHLGRYQLLRNSCVGKRVLDVACGEGYGSYLMAEWGAAEVVGIDVSADAIANAQKHFGREHVRFLCHDAEAIDALLEGEPQFDVLACFETIEHLPNPESFLRNVKKLMKPGALLVISCPNEKAEFASPGENPFHLASYTFDEFKELTVNCLGEANQWMIGTPVEGMANIDVSDRQSLKSDATLKDITNPVAVGTAALLPGQSHALPTPETCLYFVGIWGSELPPAAALASVSYKAFIEPWQLIAHLRNETEGLRDQLKSAASKNAEMQATLDNYRVRLVAAASEVHELRNDRALHAELSARIEHLTEQVNLEREAALVAQIEERQVSLLARAELERVQSSRIHRLARAYYRLYANRLVSPLLRGSRRLARNVLGRT